MTTPEYLNNACFGGYQVRRAVAMMFGDSGIDLA